MLQALRTEMFPIEGRQEDAEEFLSFILNRMNDEMIEVIFCKLKCFSKLVILILLTAEKVSRETKTSAKT
jgi:hypothetical protein